MLSVDVWGATLYRSSQRVPDIDCTELRGVDEVDQAGLEQVSRFFGSRIARFTGLSRFPGLCSILICQDEQPEPGGNLVPDAPKRFDLSCLLTACLRGIVEPPVNRG